MSEDAVLDTFRRRVVDEWLPVYCADPKRQYSPEGFKVRSLKLLAIDARDCMRAIDAGVVQDSAHGRFKARRGTATEPLFWEGSRATKPRPITFWMEPAITFAALARLHFDHGWPVDLLANQPRTWAFDLAAHDRARANMYHILGEVKKSVKEAERLVSDLLSGRSSRPGVEMLPNSAKKWAELIRSRPPLLWIVGPAGYSRVFRCAYSADGVLALEETTALALKYDGDST